MKQPPPRPRGAKALASLEIGTDLRLVLTTLAAGPASASIARTLVEERLAACVHVLPPMTSVYRWRDRIEHDGEQQLVVKTTADRLDALCARVLELHPYDLPELIVLPVAAGSLAYLDWVRSQTAG